MLFVVVLFSLATTIASWTIPTLANLAYATAAWMFRTPAVLSVSESENLRRRNQSIRHENTDLRTRNRDLSRSNRELSASNRRLTTQIASQRTVASAGAERIKRRSAYQATRSLSAIPAESIPVVGVATIIATTAWDFNDACRTIHDMSEIQQSLGQETDESFAELVCDTLPLRKARNHHYGSMTVSECRERAVEARDLVFELSRTANDKIPDLIFDLDAVDPEIRQVAEDEFDSVNRICDCLADLACDVEAFSSQ